MTGWNVCVFCFSSLLITKHSCFGSTYFPEKYAFKAVHLCKRWYFTAWLFVWFGILLAVSGRTGCQQSYSNKPNLERSFHKELPKILLKWRDKKNKICKNSKIVWSYLDFVIWVLRIVKRPLQELEPST